jgi:hypothetical protein
MTKRMMLVLVLSLGFAALTFAAEAEAVKLTGTISVTKDDDGKVTGAKLTVGEDAVYNVTMDEVGKKVAEMDGAKVEVTGTVAAKEEAKWVTVKTVKKVAVE